MQKIKNFLRTKKGKIVAGSVLGVLVLVTALFFWQPWKSGSSSKDVVKKDQAKPVPADTTTNAPTATITPAPVNNNGNAGGNTQPTTQDSLAAKIAKLDSTQKALDSALAAAKAAPSGPTAQPAPNDPANVTIIKVKGDVSKLTPPKGVVFQNEKGEWSVRVSTKELMTNAEIQAMNGQGFTLPL